MKGKIGIVVGLAAGYVLGARAGRDRYEQIKSGYLKLWNTDPVQTQVNKVKKFGSSAALALPGALWNGAVKVTKAAKANGTPGEKLDAALQAGKESADDVADAAEKTADGVKRAADSVTGDSKASSTRSSSARKSTTDSAAKKDA